MENNADKGITAIWKEFSPKNLGIERNNSSCYNSIVKLETNGLELLRKCRTEATTTSKIISTLSWEELLGKSTSSLGGFSIRKRNRSSSMMSIWLWKFFRLSSEEIANGRTTNQTLPRTSKTDSSSLPSMRMRLPSNKLKRTLTWPRTLLLFWIKLKKSIKDAEESQEPAQIISTPPIWKNLFPKE